jgi:hypothetical protein
MSYSNNLLLKAIIAHYRANKAEALAALEIYFTNSVGIGDHSSFLDEVKKWTAVLTEAEENISTLQKHFCDDEQ